MAYASALAKDEKARNEEEKTLAKDALRMINPSWDEVLAVLPPDILIKNAASNKGADKLQNSNMPSSERGQNPQQQNTPGGQVPSSQNPKGDSQNGS